MDSPPDQLNFGELEMIPQDQLQQVVVTQSKQEIGRRLIQKHPELEFQSPLLIAQAAVGEEAGLKNIEVKTCSLPLVFERGVDQAIRILDATPLAPQIAELSSEKQETLDSNLRSRMKRFLKGNECHGHQISNILISRP
jgi:hypothetical protein